MKTTKYLFLVLLITSGWVTDAKGQKNFSLNELVRFTNCKKDLSCFENHVTSNGYSLAETYTPEVGQIYRFESDQSDKQGVKNQVTFLIFKEVESASVSFRSVNKAHYLNFKKSLIDNGYKFINTKTANDEKSTIRYWYKKGPIGVCITTDVLVLSDSRKIPSYDYNVQIPINQYWGHL